MAMTHLLVCRLLRFVIILVITMLISVLLNVIQCTLADVLPLLSNPLPPSSGWINSFIHPDMGAAGFYEMSVYIYQTTLYHIMEGSNFRFAGLSILIHF